MKHYSITKGVWIDLDQIRKVEFGDAIRITWHDGSTEEFASDEFGQKLFSNELTDDYPPLLPAAAGYELVHFSPPWTIRCDETVDIDTFDITGRLVREPVIAWEVLPYLWGASSHCRTYVRNAIGCGDLQQFRMPMQASDGRYWNALILPNGSVCAYVFGSSYFNSDGTRLPTALVDHGEIGYFESVSRWVDYVRVDWKAWRAWDKVKRAEDKKQLRVVE
jgi:hypothetical protein